MTLKGYRLERGKQGWQEDKAVHKQGWQEDRYVHRHTEGIYLSLRPDADASELGPSRLATVPVVELPHTASATLPEEGQKRICKDIDMLIERDGQTDRLREGVERERIIYTIYIMLYFTHVTRFKR